MLAEYAINLKAATKKPHPCHRSSPAHKQPVCDEHQTLGRRARLYTPRPSSCLLPITCSNSQPEQPTPARAILSPAAVIYQPMTYDMLRLAFGFVWRSLGLWQGVCPETAIALTRDISATE